MKIGDKPFETLSNMLIFIGVGVTLGQNVSGDVNLLFFVPGLILWFIAYHNEIKTKKAKKE